MVVVNMHDAKTNLSKLVEQAVQGEPFVIARAGKPLVQVSAVANAVEAPPPSKIGFLRGQVTIPDDFDRMGADAIETMFEGQ